MSNENAILPKSAVRGSRQPDLQSGIALLEVMIAVLVLSLGLFSMLGLMLNSMKLTTTSTYRAIATQHAYGIAETAKASSETVVHYNNPDPSTTDSCFKTAGCFHPDMASSELAMWQQQLAEALPRGNGTVCRSATMTGNPDGWNCTAGANDPYVIKICWDETQIGVRAGTAPGQQYFECIYTQFWM